MDQESQMHWKENFSIDYTEVLNPLVCKSTRHVISSNYWWNGKLCTSTWHKNTFNLRAHTHINTQVIQILQKVDWHIFLLCALRRLALLVIMTLINYERELEPGLCCRPNSNQGVNEAEKNGPNSLMERLFWCEFQYLHIRRRLLLYCDIR